MIIAQSRSIKLYYSWEICTVRKAVFVCLVPIKTLRSSELGFTTAVRFV